MKAKRFTALLAATIAVAPVAGATAQEHATEHPQANPDATATQLHLQEETSLEHKPASIALLLGYGATLDGGRTASGKGGNGFGIGFGATAGYDISPFYVGGRFMFFLGGAAHVGDAVVSRKETTIGLEAGIPLTLARLTLRPQIGLGLAIESAERERESDAGGIPVTGDDSSEDIYVAPSLAALYALHDSAFIGVDAQVPLIIADSTLIGLAVLGSAGMRF